MYCMNDTKDYGHWTSQKFKRRKRLRHLNVLSITAEELTMLVLL